VVERIDDGAEVVDECFSWASDQEEAGSEPPHGVVGEEVSRLSIEKPTLLALFFLDLCLMFSSLSEWLELIVP
jgi:hypothetical protein